MTPEQLQKQLEDLQRRVEGLEQKRVSQTAVMPQAIKSRHLDESILEPYTTTAAVTTAITAALSGYPGIKVISGTRDMTAANGSVSYTGASFTPRLVYAFGSFTGGTIKSHCEGVTDGTITSCKSIDNAGNTSFTGELIVAWDTYATKNQFAAFSSFISGGITLSWTKTGSPSAGTFYFALVCIQ